MDMNATYWTAVDLLANWEANYAPDEPERLEEGCQAVAGYAEHVVETEPEEATFWRGVKKEAYNVAREIRAGEKPYTLATIADIATNGSSLDIICVYYTAEHVPHIFAFRFMKKGEVCDNDSRLCKGLFGIDSTIVEDLTEEEEEAGFWQNMEEAEVSTMVANIVNNREKYIGTKLYTIDDPVEESPSPFGIMPLVSREEAEEEENDSCD